MNKDTLDKTIDKVINLKIEAMDKYFQDVIEPLVKEISNPEKVIGKKFEQWNEVDRQLLTQVYQTTPEILNDFMANRIYKQVLVLEQEV